jgi:polar amino acid transport system permease protein
MTEFFDWAFVAEIFPVLLAAGGITIQVTLIGFTIAAVVGLIFAILRRSQSKILSLPTAALVEFVRSTPLLLQIFFLYYFLPRVGIVLPAIVAGVIGISLHYSCYTSEVYRAGLQSVARGQWEAAIALNLSPFRTYRDIILPQAIPPIVPPLGNYLVAMFKDTPLLSAIAVVEVMQRAKIIGSETFQYLEPITMVGVFFLVLSLCAAACIRVVDHWLKTRRG